MCWTKPPIQKVLIGRLQFPVSLLPKKIIRSSYRSYLREKMPTKKDLTSEMALAEKDQKLTISIFFRKYRKENYNYNRSVKKRNI